MIGSAADLASTGFGLFGAIAVDILAAIGGTCVAGAVIILLAVHADHRKWQRARRAAATSLAAPGVRRVAGGKQVVLLALACGPCNNVPGTSACVCAGNCGHPCCTAPAVHADLSGELQRITRQARHG